MYISNQPIHKNNELNQHGKLLRNPDSNANFMHVNRPSMGSVSSQNQATAENDNFPPASSEHSQNRQPEGIQEESVISEKANENRIDEDDRVHRISWAQDLRRTYDRPPTDGQSSPHISASNGRHSASRGMSPVEEKSARPYSSASPALLYATNAPHLANHSVLQYTSPPMVQYSTVPGFHYAPYYEPFVHLPVHSTVMRTAQSSCSEMLANMGSQVRPGPLLPHSLLPTTVPPYGAIEGSPLPSPREYPTPGYPIPGSGIYVVGVEPGSRSRHASGEQWQGNEKNEENPHPHPARERWESHERKIHEVDAKTAHNDGKSSRGPSPRDLHSSGHHVRFKEPPYQTELKQERAYHESPKVAHVLPLQPAPRKEQYPHQLPSGNMQSLYANALTIQTSMQSPPQLVSPPAAYSSLQLQLSPTPQVRSSTHATFSQKTQLDVIESQEAYNTLRMKDSPKAANRSDVKMLHGTNTSHTYPQPATHKLTADAEYPGPSTFPSYFTRGSVIQLASGVLKRVEDLCTDDFIQSAAVTDGLKIDSSTVVRIEDVAKKPVAIISFSVGENREQVTVEATLEHPFYVFGHGWSSVNPELTLLRYNLECHKLAVGDVCVSLTPKEKPPFHKEEHPETIQRTYTGNKRQRVTYLKNPSDPRDIDKNRDPYSSSEQRQHINTVNPMEHWYRPPGIHTDKHNNLASELKSLDVSSSGSTRNVSQVMCNTRTSNASARPDSKSSSIKGKHTYQTLEEVKEEEEEPSELVTKQKTSHGKTIEEPVDHLAKITIAR
ncbi:uncharacterized protein LOC117106555 isoform X2 [Anneissia japonica]|nr:uncharacterized protein LOC117106555 isoform X2 [Anneissia japonica]XP_033103828.1 uncharacterized protein LOC117106555 isoform X2 [Anneissia japonica]